MNLIVARRYINTYAKNLIRGYQEPSIVIAKIPYHRNGHFVKANKVALKYPDFKKNVDLNVHVKIFNYAMKFNV